MWINWAEREREIILLVKASGLKMTYITVSTRLGFQNSPCRVVVLVPFSELGVGPLHARIVW